MLGQGRDGDDWMSDGNEFQRCDAATGNVRRTTANIQQIMFHVQRRIGRDWPICRWINWLHHVCQQGVRGQRAAVDRQLGGT